MESRIEEILTSAIEGTTYSEEPQSRIEALLLKLTAGGISPTEVSKMITDALADYYEKSETYSKEEANDMISRIPKFGIEVVDELPTKDISETTVYLKVGGSQSRNLYDEYIYVNGEWELLGSAKIDLTNYYSKEETDEKLDSKVDKESGKGLSSNDYTTDEKTKLSGIDDGANKYVLPEATSTALGGVKVGTNLSISSGTLTANDAVLYPYEANLRWGGRNFSNGYGPIDAAMVPELGANRFQFLPADGITVEYSRDGGTTWTDYGASNTSKMNLFSTIVRDLIIGKADSTNKATANGDKYKLRVTVDSSKGSVYTVLYKFVIYVSTEGSSNCTCTIRARTQTNFVNNADTWTTFANKTPISGWPGYNVININSLSTYGNSNYQYRQIQFIFEANGGNTNYDGLKIGNIKAIGGVGWTTPSIMAKTGHLYDYDANQNANFPANINAIGTITGTNIKSKGSATQPVYFDANGVATPTTYTLNKTVPADAVFTDTKYTLPTATSTTLGGVKVDTGLNKTSKNPVENAAVANQFEGVASDILGINSVIKSLDTEIATIVNNYGSKNLANAALIPDQTAGGIARKNNGDGSITYSGTSTLTYTTFLPLMAGQKLDAGTYIFTSSPTTNTTYTYQIYKNGSYWQAYTIGAKLQITESGTYSIGLALNSKASISNTFKPMLRYASIKDDTFTPYAPTNKQLDDRTSDTGWKTTSNLKYRKSGYIVGLQGAVTSTASTMSIILGTLPEGCRPSQDIYIAQSHTDTPSRRLIIDTKGVVTMLFASNCTASHSYAYNGVFML